MIHPTIIIGAGVSGLTCAYYLKKAGINAVIYDKQPTIGGRVKTDLVDGFRLDHGFQVFLTAYSEAQRILDYDALNLGYFEQGALVKTLDQPILSLDNPFEKGFDTLKKDFPSLKDKLKLAQLFIKYYFTRSPDSFFNYSDQTIAEFFNHFGFSQSFQKQFLYPFFSGVLLDTTLSAPKSYFDYYSYYFLKGPVALPAQGMDQIPQQLFQSIGNTPIELNSEIKEVTPNSIVLSSGCVIRAKAVVIATDHNSKQLLFNEKCKTNRSCLTLYFSVDQCPLPTKKLLLNGTQQGIISSLFFPTEISPHYSSNDQTLISVTVNPQSTLSEPELIDTVLKECSILLNQSVQSWKYIKSYHIQHALPAYDTRLSIGRLKQGVYCAGDWSTNGSLQGAMQSGRLAAEALIHDGVQ